MNIGIIGFGYWGPNLVRNFSATEGCRVTMVADLRPERLRTALGAYPSITITARAEDIIENTSIDAVVIATPVFTHFSLAKSAMQNGKHVLIEKPMAMSAIQAEELIHLSKKLGKVLMVDHTFLYTGAVQKMKELIENDTVGKIRYFDSTRINLGLFQPDVNVLWDLAPHDISILSYLINEKPLSVQATGISHTDNGIENIAYMTLHFSSGIIAHFNCSWTSPVKIRMLLIGGDKKMLVYNDMELTDKVKVYDTGYNHRTASGQNLSDEDRRKILVDYRVGDVYIPKLEGKEALSAMAQDFCNAISRGTEPLSGGTLGLSVVKILEASQVSIKNKGKEINL